MSTGEGISGNSSKRRGREDRRVHRRILDSAYSPNVGECTQPACVRLLACRCTHSPPNLSPKPHGLAILPARFAMGGYTLRGSYVTVSPAANSGGAESGPLGYAGEWEVRRDYAQIYGRGGQRAVLLVGPWRGREAGLPHPTGAHEG